MKRGSACDNLPDAKKPKDDRFIHLSELKPIQDQILRLDDECADEQMKVQQQFARKLRPLYAERQKILKKIPKFWGSVMESIMPLSPIDKEILDNLEEVDVEDALDERGSYRITFTFNPDGAKKYFTPSTLVKTVTFSAERAGDADPESTPLCWTNGRDLVKEAVEKREKLADDESLEALSFLEWFTNTEGYDFPQIGETLRREVWPNPLEHLLDDEDDDDDSDGVGNDGGDEKNDDE